MKNIVKLIGFIAIIAVFGFSITSCGEDDDGGNNNNNNNNNDPSNEGDNSLIPATVLAALQPGLYLYAPEELTADSPISVPLTEDNITTGFWHCVHTGVGSPNATIVLSTAISVSGGHLNITLEGQGEDGGTLYIIGKEAAYIRPDEGYVAFTIGEKATVILGQNITLTGNSNTDLTPDEYGQIQDVRLVEIKPDGCFIMKDGSVLKGNGTSLSGHGGGVYINGGTFIMEGGEISANHSSDGGGGVLVGGTSKGTFIMKGGIIKENSTQKVGGGVAVAPSGMGLFQMESGMLYADNKAYEDVGEEGDAGDVLWVGVYAYGETATYGKFNGTEWEKAGDLTTTSSPITVGNGVKQ